MLLDILIGIMCSMCAATREVCIVRQLLSVDQHAIRYVRRDTQAALEWINMLLEKSPSDMGRFIQELLPSLLNALTDSADDVVLMNLQASKKAKRRSSAL